MLVLLEYCMQPKFCGIDTITDDYLIVTGLFLRNYAYED